MLQCLVTTYKEYRVGLLCAVLMMVYEMANYCESYMLVTITIDTNTVDLGRTQLTSCPYRPLKKLLKARQYSQFYFDDDQMTLLHSVRSYAPVFSYFITGVLADKYGGHTTAFLGLVLSGAVMASLYLALVDNFIIFMLMYAVRGFSEAVVWPACSSIIGKLARPDQRARFSSYIAAAFALSQFLGVLINSLLVSWKLVCYACGGILFTMAFFWWIVWSRPCASLRMTRRFPWMRIFGRVFIINVYLLQCSSIILAFIKHHIESSYFEKVLFFRYGEGLVFPLLLCTASIVLCLACGITIDYLFSTSLLCFWTVRKSLMALTYVGGFFSVLVMAIAGCNHTLARVFWLTQSVAFYMQLWIMMSIIIEISPTFAGTTLGISILISYVVSKPLEMVLLHFIVTEFGNIKQWQMFFLIELLIATVLVLPYMFCNVNVVLTRDYGLSEAQIPQTPSEEDEPAAGPT